MEDGEVPIFEKVWVQGMSVRTNSIDAVGTAIKIKKVWEERRKIISEDTKGRWGSLIIFRNVEGVKGDSKVCQVDVDIQKVDVSDNF